jgi:RND family efflux transporter MFP subunit
MKTRILVGLALAAVAVAGTSWFLLRPQPLDAVRPHLGQAVTAVYASGTVEASVMLPVSPRVGGRLVALEHDENGRTRKGEVLARLESADLAGNIAQLAANTAFARTDFERNQRLLRDGAVARQVYDRSLASLRAAQGALEQAQAQAGFMILKAPGDCLVIQRDGEIGQYIAANTPIFWLSCQGGLRISAQVDEEDVALVRPGQQVLIRADAFAGRIFNATVTEVTPKGDAVGRSYRVRIALPTDTPLHIGMTTESNIIARRTDKALLLPSAAVSDDMVWKIVGGRARHVRVITGAKSKSWIEIVQGLSVHDIVLADGGAVPDSGTLRLRIVP